MTAAEIGTIVSIIASIAALYLSWKRAPIENSKQSSQKQHVFASRRKFMTPRKQSENRQNDGIKPRTALNTVFKAVRGLIIRH